MFRLFSQVPAENHHDLCSAIFSQKRIYEYWQCQSSIRDSLKKKIDQREKNSQKCIYVDRHWLESNGRYLGTVV